MSLLPTHFQAHGSAQSEPEPPRTYRFWPCQVLDQLMVLFVTLSVVVGLAVLVPIRALGPADPLTRPEVVKPQWYFLPLHQLTHYLPGVIVASLVVLAGVLLLLWPFLAPAHAYWLGPRVGRRLGVRLIILLLILGGLGLLSDRSWVVLGHEVRVDRWGIPHGLSVEDAAAGAASRKAGAAEPSPAVAPANVPAPASAAPAPGELPAAVEDRPPPPPPAEPTQP